VPQMMMVPGYVVTGPVTWLRYECVAVPISDDLAGYPLYC
jgi:hypothetical protein